MQDPLEPVRNVVARGVKALQDAIPRPPVSVTDPPEAPVISMARKSATSIAAEWTKVEIALKAVTGKVPQVWGDMRFTIEERQRQAGEAIAAVRGDAQSAVDAIAAQVEQMGSALRLAALPSRPQPADAAQEAALANLKVDLRMVLDPVPVEQVAGELVELVKRYKASGDGLASWFLLSTDWPCLYLTSRGASEALWTLRVPQLVDGPDGSATSMALKLLAIIEGPKGMFGAVVGMQQLVRMQLDELARYRPVN